MGKNFAVIDIETTGGMPGRDRITEIAILVFDGKKIIDSFQSLINPERSIPPQISRITGITNEMVADAPYFYEIAKQVIEITEDCIFVAHNVRFDYNFIVNEFKSLGYTYSKRKLCTVRLARKAFPGLQSYSLGKLINHFSIDVQSRHRAYDDALAASIILAKALELQSTKKELLKMISDAVQLTAIPKKLHIDTIKSLPMECGVYYFRDDAGNILYIGKSINIYKRIKQHFSSKGSKTEKMFEHVAQIDYEITGSEIVSLLLESSEIKKHQPPINRIQKNAEFPYALGMRTDKSGYKQFYINKMDKIDDSLAFYSSRKSALNHIKRLSESFDLCLKLNNIEKNTQSCFHYTIGKCFGACIGEEPPYMYNERFDMSIDMAKKVFEESMIILENGRTSEEKTIILIEKGHYRGYSYIDNTIDTSNISMLRKLINQAKFNPEADMIIRAYIDSNEHIRIIQL